MRKLVALSMIIVSACSAPGGPYPSLQPRAAENIDPRVPITRPVNDRPVGTTLAARLSGLVGQAQDGDRAFQGAISAAERLAGAAGAPQSESWIAAQEALTAAIAAQKPTATALADIDQIGASALQTQGGIAPKDLAAIDRAAAEVAAIDQRQTDRVAAIRHRLGL